MYSTKQPSTFPSTVFSIFLRRQFSYLEWRLNNSFLELFQFNPNSGDFFRGLWNGEGRLQAHPLSNPP